jgi:hypothetical protein
MKKAMRCFLVLLFVCLNLSPRVVFSEPTLAPCKSLSEKFCSFEKAPTNEEIYHCVKKHSPSFNSPSEIECQREILHFEAHLACNESDVKVFCKGILPGQGRVMECLTEHLNELSPKCKVAIEAYGKVRTRNHETLDSDATDC